MSDLAGGLPQDLLELTLRRMPIGLSVADQDDVVLFWAGAGFGSCSPKLIGRDLHACHPKRAHAALDALLADLKSGAKDVVDTVEHGSNGSERVIYTALRDDKGAYRGVLETVVPLTEDG